MPAPKGNKFAAKDNPKTRFVGLRFRPEAVEKMKNIAKQEKISMTELIEKAILKVYPGEFDNLF